MGEQPDEELRTVRLDMKQLYKEATELIGEAAAAELWSEHNLDSEEKWPGKWAKAMELVQQLRAEHAAD